MSIVGTYGYGNLFVPLAYRNYVLLYTHSQTQVFSHMKELMLTCRYNNHNQKTTTSGLYELVITL